MKRILMFTALGCVLVAIGVLSVKIVRGAAEKEAIAARIQTLPEFHFFAPGGATVSANNVPAGKPLVVMHFLTSCHFCQGETKELVANAALLATAHIVMVSAEDAATLAAFCNEYGLVGLPAVSVVSDSLHTFGATFGTTATPVTFIYDAQHHLVKQFMGETSAKAILSILNTISSKPSKAAL